MIIFGRIDFTLFIKVASYHVKCCCARKLVIYSWPRQDYVFLVGTNKKSIFWNKNSSEPNGYFDSFIATINNQRKFVKTASIRLKFFVLLTKNPLHNRNLLFVSSYFRFQCVLFSAMLTFKFFIRLWKWWHSGFCHAEFN